MCELLITHSSIANTLAASLAPPPQDSVGARILRKMGWRLGQGIGPRITYAQRRAQDLAAGAATAEDEGDDEEAKKHMYPRRDTPLLLVSRKDNSHGLGYTPGLGLNESLGGRAGGENKGPRLAGTSASTHVASGGLIDHRSAGFGLGALNDADDDDLDVYDTALGGSKSKRILAYDAADDDDEIMIGSSRRQGAVDVCTSLSRQVGVLADQRLVKRVAHKPSTTQTFRDGRPVLKGFVLSDQPVAEDRW